MRAQSPGTSVIALGWFLWSKSQAVGLAAATLPEKMVLEREMASGEAGELGVSRESLGLQLVRRRSPAGKAGTEEAGRSSSLQPLKESKRAPFCSRGCSAGSKCWSEGKGVALPRPQPNLCLLKPLGQRLNLPWPCHVGIPE